MPTDRLRERAEEFGIDLANVISEACEQARAEARAPLVAVLREVEQLRESLAEMHLDPERYRDGDDTRGVSYAEGWNTALDDIARLLGYRLAAALADAPAGGEGAQRARWTQYRELLHELATSSVEDADPEYKRTRWVNLQIDRETAERLRALADELDD